MYDCRMQKRISQRVRTLGKILRTALSRIYVHALRVQKGLPIPKNAFIKECPYIRVVNCRWIDIAESFVLNSSNRKYHVDMYYPVKLIADGEGARVVTGKNNRLHGTCIHARGAITIGENCLIAANLLDYWWQCPRFVNVGAWETFKYSRGCRVKSHWV